MSDQGIYTFGKNEHLCKHLLIDLLFKGHAKAMTAWPIRMVYLLVDKKEEQEQSVQVLISVSKRFFKRAVKRNRVKRQIREAFRYNKMALEEQMKELSGKQLLVAFIWQDGKLHESAEINAKMHQQMKRLVEKLQNEMGVKESSCAEPGL